MADYRIPNPRIVEPSDYPTLGLSIHYRFDSNASSSCFYWLRQIRRICRSLDTESAFVLSRVDGCNTVLAGSSKATTDGLGQLSLPSLPGR